MKLSIVAVGHRQPGWVDAGCARITSYNVCYTKLLRMLQISRTIADDGEPQIGDLFAGFRRNAGPLVMVGVFFAIGVFGIALIAFLLISGA